MGSFVTPIFVGRSVELTLLDHTPFTSRAQSAAGAVNKGLTAAPQDLDTLPAKM